MSLIPIRKGAMVVVHHKHCSTAKDFKVTEYSEWRVAEVVRSNRQGRVVIVQFKGTAGQQTIEVHKRYPIKTVYSIALNGRP